MARLDILHQTCKNALINEGWTITHDPFPLRRGSQTLFVDLGAELDIAAEKEGRKIAVEIKSMLTASVMPELERALGQYILYRSLLKRREPDRSLYLAVSSSAFVEHFDTAEGRDLVSDERIRLLVFEPVEEVIERWIELLDIET